jgi:hypothetical protein
LVALAATLTGCELIRIAGGGAPARERLPDIDQSTPAGVVWLFKTEADSNNITAAGRIFATPEARYMLALEKYENRFEIERLARLISKKSITALSIDTVTPDRHDVVAEFDYLRSMRFETVKIGSLWYIARVRD